MSIQDEPKLNELKKLLRRLEKVEAEKAERASRQDRGPAVNEPPGNRVSGTTPSRTTETGLGEPALSASSDSTDGGLDAAPAGLVTSDASEGSPAPTAATGPAADAPTGSGGASTATAKPSDHKSMNGVHNGTDVAFHDAASAIATVAEVNAATSALQENDAGNAPPQVPQHEKAALINAEKEAALSRIVFRDQPPADPAPSGSPALAAPGGPQAWGGDGAPSLPTISDPASRSLARTQFDSATPNSSIGVVLIAAITAAVVSTMAAVLITVWVMRGGGPDFLTATRDTTAAPTIAGADTGTSPTATTPPASEPPAADPPPEAAVSEPTSNAVVAATGQEAAPNDTTEASPETVDATDAPVDLSALTDTAPEPDKSEIAGEAGWTATTAPTPPGSNDAEAATQDDASTASAASSEDVLATSQGASGQLPGEGAQVEPSTTPITNDPATDRASGAATDEGSTPASVQSDVAATPAATETASTQPGEAGSDETQAAALDGSLAQTTVTDAATAEPDAAPAGAVEPDAAPSTRLPSQEPVPQAAAPTPASPYTMNSPTTLAVEPGKTFAFPLTLDVRTGRLEDHFLIITGLKRGARFSSGIELMFDTWQVPADEVGDLALTVPPGFARELPLMIELRRPDGMTVEQTRLTLTSPGSVEYLGLPAGLFEMDLEGGVETRVVSDVREAERALDNGNLTGARRILERAATSGSASAAVLLGMSHDARFADKFGFSSLEAEPDSARQWYAKAAALGAGVAQDLLDGKSLP